MFTICEGKIPRHPYFLSRWMGTIDQHSLVAVPDLIETPEVPHLPGQLGRFPKAPCQMDFSGLFREGAGTAPKISQR
jgi:hypothetical protein